MRNLLAAACVALALFACDNMIEEAPKASSDPLHLITRDSIYAHLEFLADDALEGRQTGSPGHAKAAEYVAGRFAEFGLEPGGSDGWYQLVPLQSYHIDIDSPSFVIHRESGDITLVYRNDYTMGGDKVRDETAVRAEVVYIGYGVHAPEFGYSDYEGVDLKGKIVATFGGAPAALPGEERAYHASTRTKATEAVARGAIGWVALRSRHSQESYPWERAKKAAGLKPGMTWVDASGAAANYFPELLGSAYLSEHAAADLFEGTPISFEEALDSIDASQPSSVLLGIEVTLSRKTDLGQLSSPNVIGVIRGTDPELSNEYIVYTAHLDHIGRGVEVDGDDLYNGMYDNAMGTALMIEAARVLAASPLRRSIMFIALTGEEKGLLGSDYFAHYPTVPIDSIVANVNIDMPLFLYPLADVVAFGAEHSSLQAIVAAAANAEGFTLTPDPVPEENFFVRSDQYSFVRQGIPAIYLDPGFGTTDAEIDAEAIFQDHLRNHYHRPSDDLSRPIDWDSALRFARAITRIGLGIANDDARPTWNEGDFFGNKFAPK